MSDDLRKRLSNEVGEFNGRIARIDQNARNMVIPQTVAAELMAIRIILHDIAEKLSVKDSSGGQDARG